jgi:hypothetical protein
MDAIVELLSSKARTIFGHNNNECEFSLWHFIKHFARTMWHCLLLLMMLWTDRYRMYVKMDVEDKGMRMCETTSERGECTS